MKGTYGTAIIEKEALKWNLLEKVLFRLSLIYFLLYIFPFPLNYFIFGDFFSQLVNNFWQWLTPLIAANVFYITHELPLPHGSGDTTYNYIQVFTNICFAVVITILWSVFDRKRTNYSTLFVLLIILLRYYLSFTMLSYGISKIFTNQFAGLSLFDLIKTYGSSSPMGLMWNFMEYSKSYTIFSGVCEITGALLLLFRKTTKLGAFITFGVLLNVFVINMSYDVPVKLFSFHLLLMAVFILIPHINNLIRFFISNKIIFPYQILPYFDLRKWNIISYIIKGAFLVYIITTLTASAVKTQRKWGNKALLPELYGIYETQSFIVNKDTLPPLSTDTLRWKKLIIDKHQGGILKMDNHLQYLRYDIDTINSKLNLFLYDKSPVNYTLDYKKKGDFLFLEGLYKDDTIKIELKIKDRNDFLLMKRGFNWINEYPYNE